MAVDRDKVLQAAQKLVERKRYDKAIIEYQRLVAEDPKDVRTLLKIGDLYLKTEEYVEAITTYERVGEFYSSQGFALKAIAVYKQIREIINKYVPHLSDRFGHIVPRLAEIYAQLGLISDALAAYDEVASRYQKAGRERDAIDVFRKIVDLDPDNPLPHLRLAEALVRVKDHDAAIQRFGTAAEILLKLGRRDDALKVVERLLQHRQEARFARMAAEIYLDRGDPNDGMAALAKLQIAFKENPKDLPTLMLLARAFDLLNRPAQAIEVLKESARIAKEAQRIDQFAAIVSSLVARAPSDDGVKALAAQLGPADTRSSVEVKFEDEEPAEAEAEAEAEAVEEYLEPDVLPESEPPSAAAIPLRTSQAGIDPYDPAATSRQIIAQAESFISAKQVDKAIAVLQHGVQNLPAARDIRQKLCDVLFDAGDQEGAIAEMLAIAQLLYNERDVEGAARILDEVLLIEPGHALATEMLGRLGYAVQEEPYLEPAEIQPDYVQPYQSAPPVDPGYDPSAPLPSFDIEGVDPAQALSQDFTRQSALPPQPHGGINEIDDPFADEVIPRRGPPLPRYEIEDEATRFMQAAPIPVATPQPPPYARVTPAPMPAVRPAQPPPAVHAQHFAPASGPVAPPAPSSRAEALDEDALEEIDFFVQQGMFEEARNLLLEQLARLPNHKLLLERLQEIEELEAQQRGAENKSGTRAVPRPGDGEDREYDIAAALDELEMPPAQPVAGDDLQVSAESVFEEFKKGVAAQVSESDAATHYDLGVAYQEMGLLPDAIREFELAARDPARECVCQSMIGVIHLQMGNVDAAVDAFILGLRATQKTVEQELALNYEIASAYELRGDRDQALFYFQRVSKLNPNYNDPRGTVADRMRRLEVPKPPARAAVGSGLLGDDFDAAFDDLLSRSKLP